MFVDYLNKVLLLTGRRVCTFGDLVFYEYLMTGDKMFAIVKKKHKEIAVKEAKTKKKEECVKTALAKLKQKIDGPKKRQYQRK